MNEPTYIESTQAGDAELLVLMARWERLEQLADLEGDSAPLRQEELERQMLALPATTRAGLAVKAQLVEHYVLQTGELESGTLERALVRSLVDDLTAAALP